MFVFLVYNFGWMLEIQHCYYWWNNHVEIHINGVIRRMPMIHNCWWWRRWWGWWWKWWWWWWWWKWWVGRGTWQDDIQWWNLWPAPRMCQTKTPSPGIQNTKCKVQITNGWHLWRSLKIYLKAIKMWFVLDLNTCSLKDWNIRSEFTPEVKLYKRSKIFSFLPNSQSRSPQALPGALGETEPRRKEDWGKDLTSNIFLHCDVWVTISGEEWFMIWFLIYVKLG